MKSGKLFKSLLQFFPGILLLAFVIQFAAAQEPVVLSPESEPVLKPTAVISGTDTICQGGLAELNITLTGKAPWSITYTVNGSSSATVNEIRTKNYKLKVKNAGLHALTGVEDANDEGSVSGTGMVVIRSSPSAVIIGSSTICRDGQTELTVTLTGNSPWAFSYKLGQDIPVVQQSIITNTWNITVQNEGTYSLVDMSDKYCKGAVSGSAVIDFTSAPDVSISGLESTYSNQSSEWIEVSGTPTGGEFSGNGVIAHNDLWYFIPKIAPVGINKIIYKFRSSEGSCFGYDTVSVRILESGAGIIFEKERTNYCVNDPPFTVQGVNINSEGIGSFTITGNQGMTDNGDNTATIFPAKLEARQYTITFQAANGATVNRRFEIGSALEADFTWDKECYQEGHSISFTNTSKSSFGILSDNSYIWSISGENVTGAWSARNISYTFPSSGFYTIELHATNSYGCKDTAIVNFSLKPIIELAGRNYFENFEDESSWVSQKQAGTQNNSWVLGNPTLHGSPSHGFSDAFSGQNCWYTNITIPIAPSEKSWISSTCFDFTGTEKPTLVAQIWRGFNDNSDGSNLHYSVDNGKTWLLVGTINDGVNWYNDHFGTTNEQAIGWTSIHDEGWTEARHALDFLTGEPNVQFRLNYNAFGNALSNEGIAVDDIQIVERNRMTLIEHFTNAPDIESAEADEVLKNVVLENGSNIIDLHYHTAEPSYDPLNEDNPVVPNTRQFYYGVSKVPYAIINGGTLRTQRIDFDSYQLQENRIIAESLYDSDFTLEVRSLLQENTLYAKILITALQNVPLTELSVRIAVIETIIQIDAGNGEIQYRNVVKTMLPTAAGNTIYQKWVIDDTVAVRESWVLENVYNPANVRVVAFIQNETTREIYQAAFDTQGLVTSSNDEPGNQYTDNFVVFPNPVKKLVYVTFGEDIGEETTLDLFNNMGAVVYSLKVPPGKNLLEISVEDLPNGLYILRASNPQGTLWHTKIIVSK